MNGRMMAVSLIALAGCIHNAPPNVGIGTLDSFPKLDSASVVARIRQADAATVGTIVKIERNEDYEDLCALTCRLRGGKEPPRFYYAKIKVDSLIARRDASAVERPKDRWVGWGIVPGDWMPGVGLHALFLIRRNCWINYETIRRVRGIAPSNQQCETMWSLAALADVLDPAWFTFVWTHRNRLNTMTEAEATP